MPYYVYILLCKGGAYYTGYTRNVEARFRQHRRGRGARYLKVHPPKKVVYVEEFETRSQAMKRERGVKRLTHAEKRKLVRNLKKKVKD